MQSRFLPATLAALAASFALGCGSVPPAATPENPLKGGEGIHWPTQYEPKDAGFFVHNAIDVDAPPEVVWEILIRAEEWPRWYEGAQDVRVEGSPTGLLHEGASFSWSTMGLDFTSTVKELVPNQRLSWESRKSTIKGYHAWLITPTRTGCRVVTEESQHGFLTTMQKIFVPQKLRRLHDVWLAEMKRLAETKAAGADARRAARSETKAEEGGDARRELH